jgi:hypothetical protein
MNPFIPSTPIKWHVLDGNHLSGQDWSDNYMLIKVVLSPRDNMWQAMPRYCKYDFREVRMTYL